MRFIYQQHKEEMLTNMEKKRHSTKTEIGRDLEPDQDARYNKVQ